MVHLSLITLLFLNTSKYLQLELANNILAQVSMQKNWEKKHKIEIFWVFFKLAQKLVRPKNRLTWWSKTNFMTFFQILCNFQIYLEMGRNHPKNIFYLGRGVFSCILGPYLSSKNPKIITFLPLLVTCGHHGVLTQHNSLLYHQGE